MEIVIRPKYRWWEIDWLEMWRYRELFWVFAWRDLKVRYKQTVLGIAWVLFQPVVITTIFSVLFGKIAKIPSDGLPYPLFIYIGLVFWTLFANTVSIVCGSIVSMNGIMQKVYFPRIIIPVSSIVAPLVDFLVSLIPLVVMLIYFRIVPSISILPLFFVLTAIELVFICGAGMILATLQVRYRDVRYLLSFFMQIGLFITPVIYPLSVVYDYRRWILAINPLSGIIENFRILTSGRTELDVPLLLISTGVSLIIFTIAIIYFQKNQGTFTDIV